MFFHVCRFLFGLFKSPFLNSLEPCIYLSYFKPYLKPAQKKPLLVVELEELSNICRACRCLCCRLCENDRINYSLGLPGWNYVQIHKIEGKWLSGTEIHCKVLHLNFFMWSAAKSARNNLWTWLQGRDSINVSYEEHMLKSEAFRNT